jgi:large subunit ribosomal protein L9
MKVIFLKQVPSVGNKYEVKNVSDGYATNFLIPNGLALVATDGTLKKILSKKDQEDSEKKVHEDLLLKNIKDLDGVRIEMTEPANEQGHLFAGIHASEIVPVIREQTHLQILPEHIDLPKPIKEVGEHKVSVNVQDVKVEFLLIVSAK